MGAALCSLGPAPFRPEASVPLQASYPFWRLISDEAESIARLCPPLACPLELRTEVHGSATGYEQVPGNRVDRDAVRHDVSQDPGRRNPDGRAVPLSRALVRVRSGRQ